jgi:hypothetical protein
VKYYNKILLIEVVFKAIIKFIFTILCLAFFSLLITCGKRESQHYDSNIEYEEREEGEESGNGDLYLIDKYLNEMAKGNIVFNVPDSIMHINQSNTIQLLLDITRPVEKLESMIKESGELESHQIKISETMEARLSGNGFQILAITPEQQLISARETTEWRWDIKAIEEGRQRLHLTLSAILNIDGSNRIRTIRTFDRIINVRVSLGKRISSLIANNWEWLFTVLLIPLVTWLWKKRKQL